MKETACVNGKPGPPLSTMKTWPKTEKCTVITEPAGLGAPSP